jgi:hypothetical protein
VFEEMMDGKNLTQNKIWEKTKNCTHFEKIFLEKGG